MTTAQQIEQAIRSVNDQGTFIQNLLVSALGWPITDRVQRLEDISYGWSAADLRADGLDTQLIDGQVCQIQPLQADQPWGVFLLEFKNPKLFDTGRGMTGPLRKVLRGLVPSRRRDSKLAAWGRENLLFICTHGYQHFRFAYFKAPPDGTKTSPLAMFGWGPDIPARTACEWNLPAFQWPQGRVAAEDWIERWATAFDVEKVTKRFYEDYGAAFEHVEELIKKEGDLKEPEDIRLFTQTLFNRLMFLRFVERKGWLEFRGSHNYLLALHGAGGIGRKSLFQSRIRPLFFEGLAVEGHKNPEVLGTVPFLNGGLFEPSELDKKVKNIPDEAFKVISLDGLFYHYNFTVEESTPLDIEVAVDPEMLGKVFEELVTGRHESGSYYTPRPIVSFMCREALKGYLADKAGLTADAVVRLVDKHDVTGLTETSARKIIEALDHLKAVDPACGSGAYLLGLLQEMISLYRLLYSEKLTRDSRSLYDLKLRIISNNLYGVDIDPFATNIAMLRLWLSIAVEAHEPLPLPNLNFKIETGDSLLCECEGLLGRSGMYADEINSLTLELARLVKEHIKAHDHDTKEALAQAIETKKKYLRKLLGVTDKQGEWIVWPAEFPEVFAPRADEPAPATSAMAFAVKETFSPGGFDLVLANPPYVRQELIREIKPILKGVYGNLFCGTADLYCYFYIRGLQLLRPKGMLAYISSNKWFRAAYGEKLRKHIADTCCVHSIVDFGELPVFEAAATFPMVFVAQKGITGDSPVFTQFKSLKPPYPDVLAVVQNDGQKLPKDAIAGANWTLKGSAAADRLRKMEKAGVPLGEYVNGQIYYGIKTGFNEAFVIDGEKRQELIAKDRRSEEIIKPLAVGDDVRRWRIEGKDRWLIVTKIGLEIKRYPAIYAHLKRWKTELENRQDIGEEWWELRSCAYYDCFDGAKVVFPVICKEPRFTFDKEGRFTNDKTFIMPSDDYFLLGVLNSTPWWEYAKAVSSVLGDEQRGGRLMLQRVKLMRFPIPSASTSEQTPIANLVQKCLKAKGAGCEAWEKEIDERVAALYGL